MEEIGIETDEAAGADMTKFDLLAAPSRGMPNGSNHKRIKMGNL